MNQDHDEGIFILEQTGFIVGKSQVPDTYNLSGTHEDCFTFLCFLHTGRIDFIEARPKTHWCQ